MKIRVASTNDISDMVRMGRDFHAATPWAEQCGFDAATFSNTLFNLLDADSAQIFVLTDDGNVVGMGAVLLLPSYFNARHMNAQELFCWVDPDHRGDGMQLFEAMESWAREHEAGTMIVSLVPNMREEALRRLYKGKGFACTDTFFTKKLEQ